MILRGDVVYISKINTIGSEQEAGRPAVIVSNNKNNEFSETVEVIYLTSADKKDLPTHCQILCKTPSTALCEQVTTVSKNRVGDFIRQVTGDEMKLLEKCIMISLGIDKPIEETRNTEPIVSEPFFPMSDEDRVRLETERNTYKRLYEDLIERMMK